MFWSSAVLIELIIRWLIIDARQISVCRLSPALDPLNQSPRAHHPDCSTLRVGSALPWSGRVQQSNRSYFAKYSLG